MSSNHHPFPPPTAKKSTTTTTTSTTTTIRRRKNVRSLRKRDGLLRHASNITSQNGEDGILAYIFDRVLPTPAPAPSVDDDGHDGDGHDDDGADVDDDNALQQATRYCVDVGAWDGKHLSNTYSLLVPSSGTAAERTQEQQERPDQSIRQTHPQSQTQPHEGLPQCSKNNNAKPTTKWKGVLIEADPTKFLDLKRLHDPLGNICVQECVSCRHDSEQSLSSVLKREAPELPYDFDFLCIDVDGTDYHLFADVLGVSTEDDSTIGETARRSRKRSGGNYYRPKVICIEFNPTMPSDLIYVQPRNDIIRHGSSLSALVELANSAQYTLVETTLFNAFFVPNELYQLHFTNDVPDTSIEALHEGSMGTELYQLYDGTLKLWGCKKMLWHRLPMEERKMQMLSEEERLFPFAPAAEDEGKNKRNNGSGKRGNVDKRKKNPQSSKKNANGAASKNNGARLSQLRKSQQIWEKAIDMSPYCLPSSHAESNIHTNNNSRNPKEECATQLGEALRTDGFALVRGTGIPRRACHDALRAARQFLHDSDEPVRRSCLTGDRARRGYSPMCTENFASLVGRRGPNDLVKKFRVGPEQWSSSKMTTSQYGEDKDGKQDSSSDNVSDEVSLSSYQTSSSLHQPNAWPSPEVWGEDDASAFRTSIEEYFERTRCAADGILKAICDGILNQNPDLRRYISVLSESTNNPKISIDGNGNDNGNPTTNTTTNHHHDATTSSSSSSDSTTNNHHTSILTLLGYQPGSRHKRGSKGYLRPLVAAHTDVGAITVLHFDRGRCAALQRAADASNTDPEQKDWIDVDLPLLDVGEEEEEDGNGEYRDPVFVVNVGDCLSELSGGMVRSTLHRVVPRPSSCHASQKEATIHKNDNEKEEERVDEFVVRTCLALFVGLEPTASLTLPKSSSNYYSFSSSSSLHEGEGEEDVVVTYETWRRERIARATAVLKK
eukprot:CAMPEP_0183738332 /NCGR_PEP_ID=MMETSP0737-20130205/54269_1 /TAXON_ID=385413 /ORGANISM="Thalassiosira miniscula, Strain CCMP1093" /LENGTH=947 /DNA_ID=CAMNT_0025972843 /DNA_START=21 /DNA_END=2864 /DNA_ORIENTATION=+